jgi:hypothetical protein
MNPKVQVLLMLALLGLLAWAFVFRIRSDRRQPGYATADEMSALHMVIGSALQTLRPDDPRYQLVRSLRLRVGGMFGLSYLTADQVALIAPLAEQWLAGELPHLLASEYDNETGVPLRNYRARMQAKGIWPVVAATAPMGSVDPDCRPY